jgi:hypothetical protein
MPLMARSAKTSEPHKKDLVEGFKQNRAGDAVRVCGDYLDYIAADRAFAAELAASGSPVWVVHAEEKGDGGLTDAERATLEAAPSVTLVTIPARCSSFRTRLHSAPPPSSPTHLSGRPDRRLVEGGAPNLRSGHLPGRLGASPRRP